MHNNDINNSVANNNEDTDTKPASCFSNVHMYTKHPVIPENATGAWMADEGIGLYCSTNSPGIERDQILFSIPQEAVLTPQLPPGLLSQQDGIGGMSRLALRLVYEKSLGEASPFAPYIRLLPPIEEMDLPMLWPSYLLEYLQPSQLYKDVLEYRGESKRELELCRQRLQRAEVVPWLTWENWCWARALVMSRPYMMVSDW